MTTSNILKRITFIHISTAGSTYYSCGSNLNGQLGQGPASSGIPFFSTPTLIPGLSGNYTIFALPKATIAYSRMIFEINIQHENLNLRVINRSIN
jgi:hypothetical protein